MCWFAKWTHLPYSTLSFEWTWPFPTVDTVGRGSQQGTDRRCLVGLQDIQDQSQELPMASRFAWNCSALGWKSKTFQWEETILGFTNQAARGIRRGGLSHPGALKITEYWLPTGLDIVEFSRKTGVPGGGSAPRMGGLENCSGWASSFFSLSLSTRWTEWGTAQGKHVCNSLRGSSDNVLYFGGICTAHTARSLCWRDSLEIQQVRSSLGSSDAGQLHLPSIFSLLGHLFLRLTCEAGRIITPVLHTRKRATKWCGQDARKAKLEA